MRHKCSHLPPHLSSVNILPTKTDTTATVNISLVFWSMQHLNKTIFCVPLDKIIACLFIAMHNDGTVSSCVYVFCISGSNHFVIYKV